MDNKEKAGDYEDLKAHKDCKALKVSKAFKDQLALLPLFPLIAFM
ncbi:hypothetical protein [Peribacillus simplex]|nr:hypothetical protein [Peribacillus simplex]